MSVMENDSKRILEVKYKNKNIADILEMTVEESLTFSTRMIRIAKKLNLKIEALNEVGLEYVQLGQIHPTP